MLQATTPTAGAPVIVSALDRRLITVFLIVGLLFTALSGNAWRLGLPLSPDRVLIPAAFLVLFLTAKRRLVLPRRLLVCMSFFLAAVICSAFWHGTLLSNYGIFAILDRVLIPFMLFCIAPYVLSDESFRRWLSLAMVVFGVYLAVTGLLEVSGAHGLVFPGYITETYGREVYDRARGPFLNSEADGIAMAASAGFAVYLAMALRGWQRFLLIASAGLCSVGVLVTLTRSVWIGCAMGLLVLAVRDASVRALLPRVLVPVSVVFGLVLATTPVLRELITDRFSAVASVYDRQNTNAAALRIVSEEPFFGVGWLRFVAEASDWVRQADLYPVTNIVIEVHNVYLGRAAELGIPAAALFMACLALGPFRGLAASFADPQERRWANLALFYACVWFACSMFSPLPYTFANYMLWFICGWPVMQGGGRPAPVGSDSKMRS